MKCPPNKPLKPRARGRSVVDLESAFARRSLAGALVDPCQTLKNEPRAHLDVHIGSRPIIGGGTTYEAPSDVKPCDSGRCSYQRSFGSTLSTPSEREEF
jgi:hypothetical protein